MVTTGASRSDVRAEHDLSSADNYAAHTLFSIDATTASGQVACLARYDSASNSWYRYHIFYGTSGSGLTTHNIQKRLNPSAAVNIALLSGNDTPTAGARFKTAVAGHVI